MPELAWLNGRIMPIAQAQVPIEDRGYQFGDAVYEFIASYNGRLFAMDDHLNRLENSLRALGFSPLDRVMMEQAVTDVFQQAQTPRAGVYIQISRGVAPRNHAFDPSVKAQIVITVRPVHEVPDTVRGAGAHAITVNDIRWSRCDVKTVQLLPNVLAKQQAVEAGTNDAIFVAADGTVREATSSNVFIVADGKLMTHPLTPHILPGITRARIIAIARVGGLAVDEVFFNQEQMMAADEVFLTGTVTEVLPVSRINDQAIGNGRPGPLAQRLLAGLREMAGA